MRKLIATIAMMSSSLGFSSAHAQIGEADQRVKRICSAMKARSELDQMAAIYASKLANIANFPAQHGGALPVVRNLAPSDRLKVRAISCEWQGHVMLRDSFVKKAYEADVIGFGRPGAGDMAYVIVGTSERLSEVYCQVSESELRTWADSALALLIASVNSRASEGQRFTTIAWKGFETAYGVTQESCK